jgi:hypothetical protein
MSKKEKPIGVENAQRAAEKFILDRYPYATVTFERTVLNTDGRRRVYEVAGYCRLIKWPNSVGRKSHCEIRVEAYSADIVGYHGMEDVLWS